jgi:hypothetical protein
VLAGVANVASAWWYLYMTNQNSASKVPIKTWIMAALPCCLWIVAAAMKYSDSIKTHEDYYEQYERRTSTCTSTSDGDDIIHHHSSSVKEPLIERV